MKRCIPSAARFYSIITVQVLLRGGGQRLCLSTVDPPACISVALRTAASPCKASSTEDRATRLPPPRVALRKHRKRDPCPKGGPKHKHCALLLGGRRDDIKLLRNALAKFLVKKPPNHELQSCNRSVPVCGEKCPKATEENGFVRRVICGE